MDAAGAKDAPRLRAAPFPRFPKIILEIGGNPMGDPQLAASMVWAASGTGVWALKFQAYRVRDFLHRSHPSYDELQGEEMDFERLGKLIDLSHNVSMACGITVFSKEAIDLAVQKKADFIKISSGDLSYVELIDQAASSGLPLILSTGAASQEDIFRIPLPLRLKIGALMQCTSVYPCPGKYIHLAVMARWLEDRAAAAGTADGTADGPAGPEIGLSDHSLGTRASVLALQQGATLVEKHFTTSRSLPGGDNSMSILPSDAKRLARWEETQPYKKTKESAYWGVPEKRVQPHEAPALIRRHAVSTRPLKKGTELKDGDVRYLRVPPDPKGRALLDAFEDYRGIGVAKNIAKDEPIYLDQLAGRND
jgi:sialic acid synthase SpsE